MLFQQHTTDVVVELLPVFAVIRSDKWRESRPDDLPIIADTRRQILSELAAWMSMRKNVERGVLDVAHDVGNRLRSVHPVCLAQLQLSFKCARKRNQPGRRTRARVAWLLRRSGPTFPARASMSLFADVSNLRHAHACSIHRSIYRSYVRLSRSAARRRDIFEALVNQ